MVGCPACGHENPDGNRFCGACGASLDAALVTRPSAEERKVLSVLFCDLVGFTALSEAADPEDLDRMLAAYFRVARAQIEGHGGVVAKFIGDAVVGVFGMPAAHEDDPERAVRAGLRICEDAEELDGVGDAPLRLRVGVNTGEALVRLDVAPSSGEGFMVGDAINTASRIQSVAPEMGVAVGLATYEATGVVFEYEELEPKSLKGKSEPVRVFHAIAPRARLGTDLTRTHDSPFVGREIDLALLKGLFDKTLASTAPQLVTVTGEPGLGKSRLVAELAGYVDTRPELVTWRQGRCLPYGEGITFWALGEIVKAHAGILDSDPADVATAKLDAVLPEGDEQPWFRQRLLPLLGIEATSSAERDELFTAWRRFLEHIAEQHPTVLVFEDLHWADPAMLSFLVHLADRAEAVPLLIVGTTRPELYEHHPEYANGLRNTTNLNLAPLSEHETARLVALLLEAAVIPAELQRPILDRAEGNPLYAGEFVRLLQDRDLLVQHGPRWQLREGAEVPLPDSIHAVIAARLDTLPSDTKSLLADAAVIGKVFWAAGVAHMGERDLDQVTDTLRELSRKELVRPARRSSIAGEHEYAFSHVLTRDVAYNQLPRSSRASRHVAAAHWIESTAADRVEDHADVLAYHYTTALDLAHATGNSEKATELEAAALKFLTLSGERALGLDTNAARASFERALALAPEGHPERARALARFGEAAFHAGRYPEAAAALEEAIALLRDDAEQAVAAHAIDMLTLASARLGDPRTWALPAEALALLEPLGPSPALARALGAQAGWHALKGRSAEAVLVADRALALGRELGLPRSARTLGYRGLARGELGDAGGLDDFHEAIELAVQAGQGREVAVLHNNLGEVLALFEGPRARLQVQRAGIAHAEPRGLTEMVDALVTSTLGALFDVGDHEAALELADEVAPRLEASADVFGLAEIRAAQARIAALRGEGTRVLDSLQWLEAAARRSESPEMFAQGLGSSVLVRAGLGENDVVAGHLAELDGFPGVRGNLKYTPLLPAMVRAALQIRDPALAERVVRGLESRHPLAEHALVAANAALAEDRGDLADAAVGYAAAARRWERFGVVPEQAFALLGQGRCLVALDDPAADEPLEQAREIFARLQAAPHVAECDALLAKAAQHPS